MIAVHEPCELDALAVSEGALCSLTNFRRRIIGIDELEGGYWKIVVQFMGRAGEFRRAVRSSRDMIAAFRSPRAAYATAT